MALHALSGSAEKAFREGSGPGPDAGRSCFPPSEAGGTPSLPQGRPHLAWGPPQGSDGAQAAVPRLVGKVLSLPHAPHPPPATDTTWGMLACEKRAPIPDTSAPDVPGVAHGACSPHQHTHAHRAVLRLTNAGDVIHPSPRSLTNTSPLGPV